MHLRRAIPALVLLLAAFLLMGFAPAWQPTPSPISIAIQPGYDGLFRENHWFPLRIVVSNDGADLSGRLVVRPETSGNAFSNTYSTPVDLPNGSRKAVSLFVTARSFANLVRVELIDNSGIVAASQETFLRPVLSQDQLHVVITESSAGSVDLSGVRAGGYNAFQGNWRIENIPENATALSAVDTILLTDVDSGPLTSGQRQALEDWVVQGGHLLVSGGSNWQATAAGVVDLLPLRPDGVTTLDDLAAITNLTTARSERLPGEIILATGALRPDAVVLAAAPDGQTVAARRYLGLGTIDYLAFDPMAQALRGWSRLGEMWFTLIGYTLPRPSWTQGFVNPDRAVMATEILPGFNLIPDVVPLCGFLAVYVALIGPLNYLVLSRINRREFAWVTIPVFIVIFSGLAWVVGFNLRGQTATLSRLAVVQSWPDSARAQVDALVGLLSPRRTSYTLSIEGASVLKPFAPAIQSNPFAGTVQAGTDIQQTDIFRAENFIVDASFIATFSASTLIERPALSGQVSISTGDMPGSQMLRGSVRNDSSQVLNFPVILARGVALRLGDQLAPGDIQTFDLVLPGGNEPPAPGAIEPASSLSAPRLSFARFGQDQRANEQTVIDILGDNLYDARSYFASSSRSTQAQELRRRQFFLSSFNQDSYRSSGRGDRVFFAAWSDTLPFKTDLIGANWDAVDTTLHIVELAVETNLSVGNVLIPSDRFTWVTVERGGLTPDISPVNSVFQPGDQAVFRFSPIRGSVLREVRELRVLLDSSGTARSEIPLELRDWESGEWAPVALRATEDRSTLSEYIVRAPARFLGPQNAVEIRITADEAGGYLRISRLAVEQEGQF